MTDAEVLEKLKEIALMDLDNCARDIQGGGETMSHFISLNGVGDMAMYMTPWQSEEDKNAIVESVRQLFAQSAAIGYALISEVWYMTVPPGEKRPPGQPSDYPHLRKEALMATIETNSVKLQISREINRSGTEVEVSEPKIQDMTGAKSTGRMTGLLPVRH